MLSITMLQKIARTRVRWPSLPLLCFIIVYIRISIASEAGPIQHQLTDRDLKEIEDFIENTRLCHRVIGLTATIVQNDKVLLAKAFGDADVEKGEKATSKTPFCIGSLSKAFTSTLLAMQLGEGKDGINWDTPLHCFPKSDIAFTDDIRSSQANLRDVLSHKLGVPSYFGPVLAGYPTNTTRQEIIQRIRFMEPILPFRGDFLYNNYMYGVAGYAGELLAEGKSWEKLIRENIFNPAGMTSTGFIDETSNPPGLAQPYVYVNQSLYKVDTEVARTVHPLGPAGSVYSTAEDMAKWIQLHLAVISRMDLIGGTPVPFPGSVDLSEGQLQRVWETYQAEMAEPGLTETLTKPRFPIVDIELSYAMAWMRAIYRGYIKFYHTGGISTYTSLMQLLPDVRAGMFFSSSGPGDSESIVATRAIAAFISDKILGKDPWLNHSTACTFPAPWKPGKESEAKDQARGRGRASYQEDFAIVDTPLSPSPEDNFDLSTFTGTYGHMGFGSIVFYEEKGDLYMKYGRLGRGILRKTSVAGFFRCSFLDKLWFLSNRDDGRVIWRLQFVDLVDGKTQTLLANMDPLVVSRFERGLDTDNIPPHKRQYPDLYVCPSTQTYSQGGSINTHSASYFLISLLLLLQNISLLWK